MLFAVVAAFVVLAEAAPRTVTVYCPGGYRGFEAGYIVAVMPPDVARPEGGLTQPATGLNGLVLGDTVGRTPGAYGFFVSCRYKSARLFVQHCDVARRCRCSVIAAAHCHQSAEVGQSECHSYFTLALHVGLTRAHAHEPGPAPFRALMMLNSVACCCAAAWRATSGH
jgi:hypothetical protein